MDASDDTVHSSTRYYERCYSIDPKHLSRVVAVIKERTRGVVDVTVLLDKTESIANRSLDGLLENSILDAHNIDEIRIDAREIRSNGISSLSLLYRRSGMVGSIRLSITGRTDAVVAAREDIDRVIKSTARWYWPINYKGNVAAFLAWLLISGAAAMVLAAYCLLYLTSAETRKEYPNITGGLFAFIAFTAIMVMWNARDFFFPSIEFRIGRSAIAAEWRDRLRKLVFASIIGTTMLTFAGNKIWERLQSAPTQNH